MYAIVVAKLFERKNRLDILRALIKQGISARLFKRGVLAEFPAAPDRQSSFVIPEELSDAALYVNIARRNNQCVCGLSGKVVQSGSDIREYYSMPYVAVIITNHNSFVKIKKCRIVRDGNFAKLKFEDIWSGHSEKLPKSLERFRLAIQEADFKYY